MVDTIITLGMKRFSFYVMEMQHFPITQEM